jgi:ABC-type polysaccharide/polyol phosphate transport system ATPase subunit
VIVAEGISKRYPCDPVTLFPPIVSMFHRGWFSMRRSSATGEPEPMAAEADGERIPAGSRSPGRARRDDYELDDYDDLDDDDVDDEDDDDFDEMPARVRGPTPDRPGEMFWAFRDVSLSLAPGAGLGILGGPGAGKTTLLNILSGRAFPTEGRVVTRGRISPPAQELQRALALTGKGYFEPDLVMGARLVGIHSNLVKPHREEIEELAQPLVAPNGQPAPGVLTRLAAATVATIPSNAILMEDGQRGMDEAFLARIVERLRDRLSDGTAIVFASRNPETIAALCDEVIVLEDSSTARRAQVTDGGDGHEPVRDDDGSTGEPGLRVAATRAPFHPSAGLISVEVRGAGGSRPKRIDASEELAVLLRLETVVPDAEVRCGVCFVPRSGETVVRVEHPEPLRLGDPRTYAVEARVPAGTLQAGGYKVHADAVVATGGEHRANAISRDAGRVRIVGEHPSPVTPGEPVEHWDGCVAWRAAAEWSIE